ncbi:hypothetical protein ACFQJ7_17315 [Halovenus rubra]|uniref:Type I phosphodiesterase / nucleotide pyrophosphatase n=2 Tax=Halovenus rubra TaxID=869890 RepID=A0ABD5X985_9EURY|nr:hypothetical protein [Halovenus rubra]
MRRRPLVSQSRNDTFRCFQSGLCEAIDAPISDCLHRIGDQTAERTLLIITADHGHINTDPNRNIGLSANSTMMANLKEHANRTPVRMVASPRNVHLHLREGTVSETRQALSDYDAQRFTRKEAFDRGLFGDWPVTDRFCRRCGDLVVTHRDLGMWVGDIEPD